MNGAEVFAISFIHKPVTDRIQLLRSVRLIRLRALYGAGRGFIHAFVLDAHQWRTANHTALSEDVHDDVISLNAFTYKVTDEHHAEHILVLMTQTEMFVLLATIQPKTRKDSQQTDIKKKVLVNHMINIRLIQRLQLPKDHTSALVSTATVINIPNNNNNNNNEKLNLLVIYGCEDGNVAVLSLNRLI